ncbi:MAG: hypothetical protein KAS17_03515 [Victivallaceae bacterium]|nr:hypothetical protein [Victivallaceae bacterium]
MKSKIISFSGEEAIEYEKVKSLTNFCRKNLAVGIELETEFSRVVDEEELNQLFKVQGAYTFVNDDGIVKIYRDGSLVNGWELVVVGTSENYLDYHARIKSIEEKLARCEAKASTNCSMHMSLLLKQCKLIPGIVINNFYQIFKAYSDSLYWLCSATKKIQRNDPKNWIVRPRISQFASANLCRTPVNHDLKHIKGGCAKFNAINLEKMRYDRDGKNCAEMFIEIRIPDRHFVPHATTSMVFMWQAMFLKAISVSEFGLINIDNDSYQKTKEMLQKIQSGTSLSNGEKSCLSKKALEFLNFLKPELISYEKNCIPILMELAKKPISAKYRQRKNDKQIEAELGELFVRRKETKTEQDLRKAILLEEINASDKTKWKNQASKKLSISVRTIERGIRKLEEHSFCEFDKDAGNYLLALQG